MNEGKLGAPIATYERYRRIAIAGQWLLHAAGAAVAWWAAHRLDGSFLVILFALPAVGLSLMALSLLFRFLDPGMRIAVHEKGIALGRRTLTWDEIEQIRFSRVRVTRQETQATHTEVTLTVERKSGKPVIVQLSDETLPLHFEVDEFLRLVKERGVDVIDELAPREHREGEWAGGTPREPALARSLRDQFEAVLEKARNPGAIGEVMGALERGDGERRKRRFRCLGRFLGFKFLQIVSTGIAMILILAIVPFAATLLNEVLEVFRGAEGPDGLKILLLSIGTLSTWWCGTRAWLLIERISNRARRSRANFLAIRKPVPCPAGELESGNALYLRSFAGEFFRYLQTTEDRGREGLARKFETLERDLDRSILAATGDRLPLFALANSRDASAPAELRVLYVPTPDWVTVAGFLMVHCEAVILNLSAMTESVLAELWALEFLGAQDRTFVVVGEGFDARWLEEEERKRLETFPHIAAEEDGDLQERLARFVERFA